MANQYALFTRNGDLFTQDTILMTFEECKEHYNVERKLDQTRRASRPLYILGVMDMDDVVLGPDDEF